MKAMVFGNIRDVNSSIDAMRQLLYTDSIDISKQGLDFIFTQAAVDFMESMYKKTLSMFKSKLQIACPFLGQFESVKLLNSTYITLPDTMQYSYKGYGSSYQGFESKTSLESKYRYYLIT